MEEPVRPPTGRDKILIVSPRAEDTGSRIPFAEEKYLGGVSFSAEEIAALEPGVIARDQHKGEPILFATPQDFITDGEERCADR